MPSCDEIIEAVGLEAGRARCSNMWFGGRGIGMSDWMDELGQKVKDANEQAKEATSNQEAENVRLQPLVVDFSHRFLERWKTLTTRFNSTVPGYVAELSADREATTLQIATAKVTVAIDHDARKVRIGVYAGGTQQGRHSVKDLVLDGDQLVVQGRSGEDFAEEFFRKAAELAVRV